MFSLFIELLRFSSSLAHIGQVTERTKFLFLNNEPYVVRPTLIHFNHVELKYYSYMISLNISPKICVPNETKNINVMAFNMITNKNETNAMREHISCDCKCKFNSTICNSNQKRNTKTCQCKCKSHVKCKKNYSWNPSTCICENSRYLKSITDT